MRSLVLLDLKIDKDEALDLLDEYSDFFEQHTSIRPVFWVERRDFSIVPTTPDSDGDLKPTYNYRKGVTDEVYSRYGTYGTDNVILMVHEDNFLFKGVWGTAWSYTHRKYNLLLCRWDRDNKVNTFNTLFHEGEHPHDTVIFKELGIDINPLIENHFGLKNFDYDRDYVHGGSPLFKYIGKKGYKRDGRMLEFLAPYLRQSYKKREEKHLAPVKETMKKIISLLQDLVARLRKEKGVGNSS